MLLQRERHLAPVRALMPAPAPLPSLPNALRRRAVVFRARRGRCGSSGLPRPRQGVLAALRRVGVLP